MSDTHPPLPPPQAVAVLQQFLAASLRHDEPAMRACLSRATLESGSFHDSTQEGIRYELGDATAEGDKWVIPVKAFPADTPPDTPAVMELPAILLQEDGAWKFDLAGSMDRFMGGSMQQAVEQIGDAMGQVLGQAMDGIGQALGQALGTSAAPSPRWLETETAWDPQELLPFPPLVPLPKITAALSAICRHPVRAEAAIADLLKQVHSDDSATLIDWFDNQLFAGWISMLALLAQQHPVIRRLSGFRLEAAREPDNRMLILDGNDLVYRMYINSTSGYYSDEYANEILPGVLAALPENPDPVAANQRTLLTDEEPADLNLFKSHEVPRQMRRICELLGKEIALDTNWDDVFDAARDTRQLYRWTLNRIYGALSLACEDPHRAEKLRAEFRAIHITLVFNITDRAASYTDGTLQLALHFFPGESGCFYETELLHVLQGAVIQSADASAPAPAESPAAESTTEARDDRYTKAAACLDALAAAMKRHNLWPGDKPPGEIEVHGAFGCENMAFTQWLAWVLMPRVQEIIDARGEFPPHSEVAAYAVREFDGVPEAAEVVETLIQFDALFNPPSADT